MSNLFLELNADSYENVYICGDLHGCYDQLMEKLKSLSFNKEKDLLVLTGDLVDRGAQNKECVQLLDEKWVVSCLGNHDSFCMSGYINTKLNEINAHCIYGGTWFYEESEESKKNIVGKFMKLPIMIELSYKGKKIGIVHGDLPKSTWQENRDSLFADDRGYNITDMLFGRSIYKYPRHVEGIDYVFLGHTITNDRKVQRKFNCFFLDTGLFDHKQYNQIGIVNLKDVCT